MKHNKKVTCIIQARTDSQRLQNKVLEEIEGSPMISHIIRRVKLAKKIQQIILATSDRESDRVLLKIAKEHEIIGFAGNEEDVLARFFEAAKKNNADPIIRITGDCPLVDYKLIDDMVEIFENSEYDYMSNTIERTFPDGLDVEIFSFDTLKQAHINAEWKSEREHVTPYIIKNKQIFSTFNYKSNNDFSSLRWSVDEKDDLIMIKQIFVKMKPEIIFSTEQVLKLIHDNPEIAEINNKIKTNEGYEKSLRNDKKIKSQ